MESSALEKILTDLIATWENEVVEFKQAGNDYSTHEIGKYFSALSNEANLRSFERAWMVLGVHNKTRKVVGSDYRPDSSDLQSLKMQIARDTEPSVTLREIHVLPAHEGRVVLFEIPAAPRGMPIAWKGHYYARAGESLVSLGLDKQDEIRRQTIAADWSAQPVPDAKLSHIDDAAIQKAHRLFAQKYSNRFEADEVLHWPLQTFLDRARLTQDGVMTRTALLLLGKPESAYLLSPHPAQMTWKLEGAERAYEHFGPPFLLNTTVLYQRIRNIQIRILPNDELFPMEVAKYEQKVVMEALHNCIAHQDYDCGGRIVVTECPDKLVFENEGSFFEGKPEDYIVGNKTPRRYRNPFLAQAMTELNMIDTMGYGIFEMHRSQARRFFPMPDYDLSEKGTVRLTVHGKIVDPAYSRILMQKIDLPLIDILALDRVQKSLPITEDMVKHLRKAGLVEGRKPHFHVSAIIAGATANKADYIHTRAQDDVFYIKLITDYLSKFKQASRQEIDKLLWNKLSDALDEKQKDRKIANLLTKLRRSGLIRNTGPRRAPQWELAE